MPVRLALVVALLLGLGAPVAAAPPTACDEALRLTPPDAALVLVVQNLRDHLKEVSESPFAAWFPSSALGKHLLNGQGFKHFTDGATPVFDVLGITPTDLIHEIIGDAVVFAYSPAPPTDPKGERSVILVRPRKPDALAGVFDRLNDAQKKSGELKDVIERKHNGSVYVERRKPDGASEFYCFRNGVFAFSQSETDLRAVLERDKLPKDKPAELSTRLAKLGVSGAAVLVLVNPRPLDGELAAKVKAAGGDEKAFLTKFAEVWAATDALAVYFSLGKDAELGVSVNFTTEKLPANLKGWLVGPRTPSTLWANVPENAILAVAGRVKPNAALDLLTQLAPTDGKAGVRESLESALGPVLGKDKLPLVLDALGPDWGLWVAPPAKGSTVPVAVAAVRVNAVDPKGAEAAKSLAQALEFGFQMARVAYNTKHKDQLELKDEKDADAVIKSLSGGTFPAGFAPSFALKGGYLLLSTSPDAIKSFKPPVEAPKPGGDVPLARFNALVAREYLAAHTPQLAQFLARAGAGEEKALAEQLGNLALVLESVDKVELLARGDTAGLRLMLRVKPAKPLKK